MQIDYKLFKHNLSTIIQCGNHFIKVPRYTGVNQRLHGINYERIIYKLSNHCQAYYSRRIVWDEAISSLLITQPYT